MGRFRIAKGVILGLAAGVLGLAASLAPDRANLEERFGLDILFRLRGPRTPPPDVVVVSIDKESADRLDLDEDFRKWPRTLHARLTENLANGGAKVIAFDVFFEDPSVFAHDRVFGEAIRKAGNVLLGERLQCERIELPDTRGRPGGGIEISRRFPPTSL
ncbi:MAG: CHASE2 domain-containing protein, partial [Deltaproteobacteria bacterium]|nr:CHASE2 domain-containing protein [Deltaproteobacteria bacterium]